MNVDDLRGAQEIFEGRVPNASSCYYCAGLHDQPAGLAGWQRPCPRVKLIEFYESGLPKTVEFWEAREAWETFVIFPRDAFNDDKESDGSSA